MSPDKKFCANCVHLLGKRFELAQADKWNCCHPQNVCEDKYNLVTGERIREFQFGIVTFRHEGCKGDLFEEYIPPRAQVPVQEKYQLLPGVTSRTQTSSTPPVNIRKPLSKINSGDL